MPRRRCGSFFFLQKCNLEQFFVDKEAEEIKSDLKTIKNCLKLIQDATSDTTKIAEQIAILEKVLIVKFMVKVSDPLFASTHCDLPVCGDVGIAVAVTIARRRQAYQ